MNDHGKRRGLHRLADERGLFKMLAVDQRPPVERLLAERRGIAVASSDDLVALKRALLEELGPLASAVLLDPLTAYPAGDRVDPRQGMMLTLEHAVVEEGDTGKRSRWIESWSVDQIKRAGADGVKLLAWYRPDAGPDVLEHQQSFVEATGAACDRYDIPFVLELLLYPFQGASAATTPRHGAARAEHVLASVETFADPRYGVDVFKVESPYLPAELPSIERDGGFHQAVFDDLARIVGRPWVLLSGGADRPDFLRALEYAYAAGASGYLAGRSIWWDAATEFPDWAQVRDRLRDDAAGFMRTVNELTEAQATPWTARARPVDDDLQPGPEFCRSYERIAPDGGDASGRFDRVRQPAGRP